MRAGMSPAPTPGWRPGGVDAGGDEPRPYTGLVAVRCVLLRKSDAFWMGLMRLTRSCLPLLVLLLIFGSLLAGPGALAAAPGGVSLGPSALEPASTGGLAVVDRALAKLVTHRRLLVVGAHPDDEDTSALTLNAREAGGESAYLSLSRGEGGQNLIGPELGVDLGLLRSRELLAARGVDGGRQFFTRAYDFGYTRSLDETFEKWPKEILLEDAVRVIRRFRPQVVISVFPGNPRAGHGQHQAAGVVAHEAFELAGDPAAFADVPGSEVGAPWAPEALFRATWWDRDSTTLTTELGRTDPLAGRTTFQIAMESRSQHRSQDMGRILPLGDFQGRYGWVAGPGGPESSDLFDGIDTRLEAIADLLPEGIDRRQVSAELAEARELAEAARLRLAPRSLGTSVPALAKIRGGLADALLLVNRLAGRQITSGTEPAPGVLAAQALIAEKLQVAETALAAAADVGVDAWTERSAVAPGEGFRVEAVIFHGRGPAASAGFARPVEVLGVELAGPEGRAWQVVPVDLGAELEEDRNEGTLDGRAETEGVATLALDAGALAEWGFDVAAPADAAPSRPYFLERPFHPMAPTAGDTLYDWSATPRTLRDEPFGPTPLVARFALRVLGEKIVLEREVVERVVDQAEGEVRRPLRVVPRLEVAVEPDLVVWSPTWNGEEASRHQTTLRVTLRSHVAEPLAGRVRLEGPDGWSAPEALPFAIGHAEGDALVELPLVPPAGLERGHYRLAVVAELDAPEGEVAESFRASYPLVDYPHIRATPAPRDAKVEVAAAPIDLPALVRGKVGFVLGASERVPEALSAIGVPIETLTGADLGANDLARFDAIVVGSRAYETDPELGSHNGALLDYARAGGLVIVLYQQYQFVRGGYAPFPLDIARPHDRVTDETAPVTLLEPDHPVFNTPNRLGPEDWEGWVQERGLYFAHTWDEAYRPLLQFPSDPALGEATPEGLRGGLLVAELGEGTYVYTGLAFFRELPAGVTGAYRLFANLLALAD